MKLESLYWTICSVLVFVVGHKLWFNDPSRSEYLPWTWNTVFVECGVWALGCCLGFFLIRFFSKIMREE